MFFQPVAVAIDCNGSAVMHQTIDDCSCIHLFNGIAKDAHVYIELSRLSLQHHLILNAIHIGTFKNCRCFVELSVSILDDRLYQLVARLGAGEKTVPLLANLDKHFQIEVPVLNNIPLVCEKGTANKPLTEEQEARNRIKSNHRCRIEHIFGFIENSMGGSFVRCVGIKRTAAYQWLTMFVYNICQQIQLQA